MFRDLLQLVMPAFGGGITVMVGGTDLKIQENCIVSISFRLTDDEGELLDESPENQPLVYLHGGAGVLPKLEEQLTGMSAGEQFDVTIEPEDGFGERRADLLQRVPIDSVPAGVSPSVGMPLQLNSNVGGTQMAVVAGIDDESLTVDLNHPLAGTTLHFRGAVKDVRVATEQEIEAGGPAA